MRRALPFAALAAGAVVAAGALLATPAAAEQTTVLMPGKFFAPARPQIVVGDELLFRNTDLVVHDVRVPAGPFDSGPLARQAAWAQRFDAAGAYPFLCTLHPFMTGTAEVVNATIAASPARLVAGEPLTLAGRAPAGTAAVGLVRVDADGATHALPGAAPAADGSYAVTTPAVAGARYRISTPRGDSPEVAPEITARVRVHLTVRHRGRRLLAQAHTTPPAAGLLATLQLYDRWHYRWRGQRTVELGAEGTATFTLPGSTRTYARVALRRAQRGRAIARSDVIRTRDGRPARDPDLIVPEHAGGHGGSAWSGAGGGGGDGADGGAGDHGAH